MTITNTTQLSTFSIIKGILKNNSTLAAKFKDSDYYEFEPNLKSMRSSDLPYIVIELPTTDTGMMTLNNSKTFKDLSISIMLVIDYDARSKFLGYANAIIRQIESAETTFEASGYYGIKIDLIDTSIEVIDQKQVIVGEFEITSVGSVRR